MATTLLGVPAAPAAPVTAAPAGKPACPADRPDEAAALVTARLCGGEVKIARLTNEYDEGWAQPNGQVRWQHHYRPVRIQQNNAWVPVDTTLVAGADGTVRPKAAAVDLTFSGGGSGSMVTVGEDGGTLKLGSPLGALPEPVLDGDTATYLEVLPGVDLKLRADVDGYAQVLVVKDREAAENPELETLEFPVSQSGLTVSTDKAGNLKAAGKDGKARFVGNAPLMWDAPVQETADGTGRAGGRTKVMPSRLSDGTLSVRPVQAMLDDPATEYPVYLDPGAQAARSAWTMIDSGNPNTSYWNSSQNARVGTNNGGTNKYRSFYNLNVGATPIAGKHIVSSNLTVTETGSASCTPRQVDLWSSTGASSATTWNNPPTFNTLQSSQTVAKGFSSSCPAGTVVFSASQVTQAAANGSWQNVTLALRSPNETDSSYYKQFNNNPYLSITYSAYASISSRATTPYTECKTGSGRPYINTVTPTLQARVNDPEGASVRPQFEWSTVGGSAIGSAQPTPGKASGQSFTATVPAGAFVNGGSYSWRARGFDSTSWGPWAGGCEFTVDTTAPVAAPTVTSTAYPEGQWAGTAGTTGSFTIGASGTADTAAYVYGLDEDPATVVNASTLGGSASISLAPEAEGKHDLKVRARDRAGNLSPVRTYTFYVGAGAVTAPDAGTTTAGKVTLSGLGRSGTTGVTYQWRRGDVDTWATVPAGDVTSAAGGAIAWPIPTAGSGTYPDLVWNLAQTVNDAEAGPEALNGPLQVRASFSGSGSGISAGIPITIDRDRTEAATSEAGPGEVNLLTGNYMVGASDAGTIGGLALQRAFNTRAASDPDPMFGPGWTASVKAAGTTIYTKLTVTGSLVQVGLADGGTLGFTKKSATSDGATYTPQMGAEDAVLTYTTTGDTYLLKQKSGDTVTFSNRTSGVYVPTALRADGAANESKISWENVTVNGTATIRPTQLLAVLPAGVTSCTPMVQGCRALTFTYTTATTAANEAPGDYLGRLKQLSLTAWDPDLPTPAMRTVVLAQYSYDSNGRLHAEWDPRLDYTNGGVTKHVATSYTYNTDGTLATLTPPGEEPWQFTYTTVPGDSGAGRLYQVSRSALSAGTAVQTIVYKVRISGPGAPVDMAPNINRWGQSVLPVDATAIYPPDIIPDGDPATGTLPSNSADNRVTVTYMDPNGLPINTMYPGGTVNATWYDKYGNIVRELDAGNLAEALWRSEWDSTEEEIAYAQRESTEYHYSADGRRLLQMLEPERAVVLANGQSVRGRPHLVNDYDEGAPSGATHDVVTTATKSLQYLGNGAAVEADELVTSTTYDWTQDTPMPVASTVDPDGLTLTSRTTYDSQTGQIASTTSPAGNAAGTTAATRRTVYYRAGTGSGYSECDNHAEWAGMPCRVFAAAQPSGTELPVTVTTYNLYGQARTIVQKNSSTTLRTATIDSDAAGRPTDVKVTAATGTPIERRRTVYDPPTGQKAGQQTLNSAGAVTASVTTQRDSLGRMTAYIDADGNTSTTTYDLLSRPATISDGKGTQTFAYAADLATQLVDSQAGTFTATYYNNGNIATENRPDGITVNHYYNEAGQATGVDYSTPCEAGTCWLYYDYAELDAHQRVRWSWSSFSNVGYAYDKAGRLVDADQMATDGCARRAYTFDKSTNRTQLASYAPAEDGTCQQTTASTRTWTYDQADRVTTPSHNIDTLGRTLAVPSADLPTSTGDVQLTYYTNDMTATITSADTQASYTLDVLANRYRSYTTTSGNASATHVNHYSDDTDKPSWIAENSGYTRRINGLSGPSAFYTGGHLEWQFENLHGDIVAMQAGGTVGLTATYVTDEYGKYVSGGRPRYGYLGSHQRSADNPGGLMTMGVRVYNPETGRFLSTDPVYGGNNNAYEYSAADPVNKSDVSGAMWCYDTSTSSRKWYYWWGRYGGIRKDRNFQCVITNWDFKAYKKAGNYMIPVGLIATFLSVPVGAAFGLAAWVLKDWIYETYDEECDRDKNGAILKFRHSKYYDRDGYFWAGTYGYRGAKCRPAPRWYD